MRTVRWAAALALAAAVAAPPLAAAEDPAPGAPAPDPAAAATAARASGPDLRARPVEVVGVAGLVDLAAPDPEVANRAASLRTRRVGGIVSFAGAAVSFVAGGVLVAFARADADATNQVTAPYCGTHCTQVEPNYTPAYVAYGVAAGLAVVGLLVWPGDHEYADAVDLWNARHPGQPAEWVGWSPREAP